MKNKYFWVGSIMGLAIVLDQLTKYVVMKSLRMYDSVTVIPGFFNLTYVRNKGAAFGILSGNHGIWRIVFFVVVTLVAVAAIFSMIRKTSERLSLWAFSLIAGGAIGNLIDRIRFGEVVDFIEWYARSYHWPTFNVADSAISVGVGLLVIEMLFFSKAGPGENSKT